MATVIQHPAEEGGLNMNAAAESSAAAPVDQPELNRAAAVLRPRIQLTDYQQTLQRAFCQAENDNYLLEKYDHTVAGPLLLAPGETFVERYRAGKKNGPSYRYLINFQSADYMVNTITWTKKRQLCSKPSPQIHSYVASLLMTKSGSYTGTSMDDFRDAPKLGFVDHKGNFYIPQHGNMSQWKCISDAMFDGFRFESALFVLRPAPKDRNSGYDAEAMIRMDHQWPTDIADFENYLANSYKAEYAYSTPETGHPVGPLKTRDLFVGKTALPCIPPNFFSMKPRDTNDAGGSTRKGGSSSHHGTSCLNVAARDTDPASKGAGSKGKGKDKNKKANHWHDHSKGWDWNNGTWYDSRGGAESRDNKWNNSRSGAAGSGPGAATQQIIPVTWQTVSGNDPDFRPAGTFLKLDGPTPQANIFKDANTIFTAWRPNPNPEAEADGEVHKFLGTGRSHELETMARPTRHHLHKFDMLPKILGRETLRLKVAAEAFGLDLEHADGSTTYERGKSDVAGAMFNKLEWGMFDLDTCGYYCDRLLMARDHYVYYYGFSDLEQMSADPKCGKLVANASEMSQIKRLFSRVRYRHQQIARATEVFQNRACHLAIGWERRFAAAMKINPHNCEWQVGHRDGVRLVGLPDALSKCIDKAEDGVEFLLTRASESPTENKVASYSTRGPVGGFYNNMMNCRPEEDDEDWCSGPFKPTNVPTCFRCEAFKPEFSVKTVVENSPLRASVFLKGIDVEASMQDHWDLSGKVLHPGQASDLLRESSVESLYIITKAIAEAPAGTLPADLKEDIEGRATLIATDTSVRVEDCKWADWVAKQSFKYSQAFPSEDWTETLIYLCVVVDNRIFRPGYAAFVIPDGYHYFDLEVPAVTKDTTVKVRLAPGQMFAYLMLDADFPTMAKHLLAPYYLECDLPPALGKVQYEDYAAVVKVGYHKVYPSFAFGARKALYFRREAGNNNDLFAARMKMRKSDHKPAVDAYSFKWDRATSPYCERGNFTMRNVRPETRELLGLGAANARAVALSSNSAASSTDSDTPIVVDDEL